jgi:hypothetical protein
MVKFSHEYPDLFPIDARPVRKLQATLLQQDTITTQPAPQLETSPSLSPISPPPALQLSRAHNVILFEKIKDPAAHPCSPCLSRLQSPQHRKHRSRTLRPNRPPHGHQRSVASKPPLCCHRLGIVLPPPRCRLSIPVSGVHVATQNQPNLSRICSID